MQRSGVQEKLDCGVLGKRSKRGAEGPIGPHLLGLDLNSEPAASRALRHQHSGRSAQQSQGTCVRRVSAEGAGEGARGWHRSPALVFPSPSDEAEGAQSSQGNSNTAHLCMFYNGVDKIPVEPWSMCEEFPPEI